MTKQELLKYLTDCKDLELTLYNLQSERDRLYGYMNSLGNEALIPMPSTYQIMNRMYEPYNDGLPSLIIFIILLIVVIIIANVNSSTLFIFAVYFVGVGFIALMLWLLLSKISEFICEQIHEKRIHDKINNQYQIELAAREVQVQQDLQRVAEENKRKPIIQSRIDDINRQITDTTNALKKLYAVGVVYQKYRALVPIVMFCEYLESGRCDGLEGHEGAYNIYENELRQNIIIAKLDVVINKLDQIRQNQYMLADAIERGNRQVERLCNATVESAAKLESIQQNAAITAENARK